MRPVRYVFDLLVSVAIGTTGCGGSGDDTGTNPGGGGNPTIVTPSAAEKNAVSAHLCGYEDGRAPFTVSASEPVPVNGNTASGSRTAVLSNAQIRVLFLGIGCGIPGAPC